jgi:hypothetical protein
MSAALTGGRLLSLPISSAVCRHVRGVMCVALLLLCRVGRPDVIAGRRVSPGGNVRRELLHGFRNEPHLPSSDRWVLGSRAPIGPGRRHDCVHALRSLDPQGVGAVRAEYGHFLTVPRVDPQGDGHPRTSGSGYNGSLLGTSGTAVISKYTPTSSP